MLFMTHFTLLYVKLRSVQVSYFITRKNRDSAGNISIYYEARADSHFFYLTRAAGLIARDSHFFCS